MWLFSEQDVQASIVIFRWCFETATSPLHDKSTNLLSWNMCDSQNAGRLIRAWMKYPLILKKSWQFGMCIVRDYNCRVLSVFPVMCIVHQFNFSLIQFTVSIENLTFNFKVHENENQSISNFFVPNHGQVNWLHPCMNAHFEHSKKILANRFVRQKKKNIRTSSNWNFILKRHWCRNRNCDALQSLSRAVIVNTICDQIDGRKRCTWKSHVVWNGMVCMRDWIWSLQNCLVNQQNRNSHVKSTYVCQNVKTNSLLFIASTSIAITCVWYVYTTR